MKTSIQKYGFCSILVVALFLMAFWQSERICSVLGHFFQYPAKDATIIIANDNDQTMKEVFPEFKKFNIYGYKEGEYPQLDSLYSSRQNWRFDKITWFNTSIKMQSYGAEKDIRNGDWNKYIILLDDCIAGYEQFIPKKQETSAITYLGPCLNLSKRIAMADISLPSTVSSQVIEKLNKIKSLIQVAPPESTNNFKEKALEELEEVLYIIRCRADVK